ncbi:hypothetical protein BGP_0552 [Beggiatoa sp. PS]|nr:hypothetical protein BGP_0552 [Beggiatoa sp. PS]
MLRLKKFKKYRQKKELNDFAHKEFSTFTLENSVRMEIFEK